MSDDLHHRASNIAESYEDLARSWHIGELTDEQIIAIDEKRQQRPEPALQRETDTLRLIAIAFAATDPWGRDYDSQNLCRYCGREGLHEQSCPWWLAQHYAEKPHG